MAYLVKAIDSRLGGDHDKVYRLVQVRKNCTIERNPSLACRILFVFCLSPQNHPISSTCATMCCGLLHLLFVVCLFYLFFFFFFFSFVSPFCVIGNAEAFPILCVSDFCE